MSLLSLLSLLGHWVYELIGFIEFLGLAESLGL